MSSAPQKSVMCTLDNTSVACDTGGLYTYTDLAGGEHEFTVTGSDQFGQVVGTSTVHFVVDAVGPTIAIATPSSAMAGGLGSTCPSGVLTFACDETQGNVGACPPSDIECQIDDGPFAPCVTGTIPFALPPGAHTLTVQGFDNCNNPGPLATLDWSVSPCLFPTPPQGACAPANTLAVLVTAPDDVPYVPQGRGSRGETGIAITNIEGTSIDPTTIPTAEVVASCAADSTTGRVICTGTGSDVYFVHGTTFDGAFTSGASGSLFTQDGFCANCAVTMDTVSHRAVIDLSAAPGVGGYQILDLGDSLDATASFEPAFASPLGIFSEGISIDPYRDLILSPNLENIYELVNVSTSTSPRFFEMPIPFVPEPPFGQIANAISSGEDCTTGIALASGEDTDEMLVTDLSRAKFNPGSQSWTAPSQTKFLTETDGLAGGNGGIAIAQGTHTGIVTGAFDNSSIVAIALPQLSGFGTPDIPDWVTCAVAPPFSFTIGGVPHAVTAYRSPANGHAIGIVADFGDDLEEDFEPIEVGGPTMLAVVDLTMLLDPTIVPRTAGGHGCADGVMPPSVVQLIQLPACLQNSDCASGYCATRSNSCEPPALANGGECRLFEQCQSEVCTAGVCVPCSTIADCPLEFYCDQTQSVCLLQGPEGTACTIPDQCETGFCDAGECNSCQHDVDCEPQGANEICDDGGCHAPGPNGFFCFFDEDHQSYDLGCASSCCCLNSFNCGDPTECTCLCVSEFDCNNQAVPSYCDREEETCRPKGNFGDSCGTDENPQTGRNDPNFTCTSSCCCGGGDMANTCGTPDVCSCSCSIDADCAAFPMTYCDQSLGCTPFVATGMMCGNLENPERASQSCQSGCCDLITSLCGDPMNEGCFCEGDQNCQVPNSYCDSGTDTCTQLIGLGQICGADNSEGNFDPSVTCDSGCCCSDNGTLTVCGPSDESTCTCFCASDLDCKNAGTYCDFNSHICLPQVADTQSCGLDYKGGQQFDPSLTCTSGCCCYDDPQNTVCGEAPGCSCYCLTDADCNAFPYTTPRYCDVSQGNGKCSPVIADNQDCGYDASNNYGHTCASDCCCSDTFTCQETGDCTAGCYIPPVFGKPISPTVPVPPQEPLISPLVRPAK